jgi:hypothetical protein
MLAKRNDHQNTPVEERKSISEEFPKFSDRLILLRPQKKRRVPTLNVTPI